jgi:hypothetical protein
MLNVLTGGPWSVSGAALALERWRKNFKPNRDTVSKATVWIRLPGLPNEYWERDMVIDIPSKAGKPIAVDVNTEELLKGAFAHACVEIDLTKPLVAGILVGVGQERFFQEFIYEGIAIYCYRCGMAGHRVPQCPCIESGGSKRKIAVSYDDWLKMQHLASRASMEFKPVGEATAGGRRRVEVELT